MKISPTHQFWIVLLSTLTILNIFIFSLGSYFIQTEKNGQRFPVFPLDDQSATYTIIKGKNYPWYNVTFRTDDTEQTAMVGSTLVDIDNYLNQPVQINGKFNEKAGKPYCHRECPDNIKASLIDIYSITIATQ